MKSTVDAVEEIQFFLFVFPSNPTLPAKQEAALLAPEHGHLQHFAMDHDDRHDRHDDRQVTKPECQRGNDRCMVDVPPSAVHPWHGRWRITVHTAGRGDSTRDGRRSSRRDPAPAPRAPRSAAESPHTRSGSSATSLSMPRLPSDASRFFSGCLHEPRAAPERF